MRRLLEMMLQPPGSVVTTLIVLISGIPSAMAQMDWNGSQSTSWINGLNWTPVGPPASDTEVLIDTVSPNVTLINGWNVTAESIEVGVDNTASLEIRAGGTLATDLASYIGRSAGSEGTVTVTGLASHWDGDSNLFVGGSGTGNMIISAGGQVSNNQAFIGTFSGGAGSVLVTDTGSLWQCGFDIWVAQTGTAILSIENGGQVNSPAGYLGLQAESDGMVTVTGAGSSWNMTEGLTVGSFGTGTLMIGNGGVVDNGTTGNAIGEEEGSMGTVLVTGPGSTWNLDTFLAVGTRGNAQLTIEDGAQVNGDSLSVGIYSPASGMVVVSGVDSQLMVDDYLILGGQSGAGTLLVEDGATVMIGDWMRLAGSDQTAGTAVVTGDNSILNIGGDLNMGLNDFNTLSSFTVETGGAVSVGGAITVAVDPGSDSNLHVNANLSATGGTTINTGGWLDGDGSIGGGPTTILGTIAPGNPVGTLSLRGLELTQDASLMFDLDDLGSAHDSLLVVQDLVLDGILSVHNLGGLEEGEYTLITYGGTLTDQGLEIGTFPDGFTGIVHTDVPGEVRLQIIDVIFADQFEDT